MINGNARIEFKDNAINLTFLIFSQLCVSFSLFTYYRERKVQVNCKERIRFLYLGICENLVHSCPRPSLRNDRKQADEHRCAIANWNARGKIKYDSYSIFKRGSCKTNNATYENFYHVQISTKYFVNNHLRQSARDFRLYTISVVNQKDILVVEDKCKANFIRDKKRRYKKKINPFITTLSKFLF